LPLISHRYFADDTCQYLFLVVNMGFTKKQTNALLRVAKKELQIPSGYVLYNREKSIFIHSSQSFGFPQKDKDKLSQNTIDKIDLIISSCFDVGDFFTVDYPAIITRKNTFKYHQHLYNQDVLLLASREEPKYRAAFRLSYVNTAFEALGPKAVAYIGKWNGIGWGVPILLMLSNPAITELRYGMKAFVAPLRNFDFDKNKKWR
jgi:hypothetical protein